MAIISIPSFFIGSEDREILLEKESISKFLTENRLTYNKLIPDLATNRWYIINFFELGVAISAIDLLLVSNFKGKKFLIKATKNDPLFGRSEKNKLVDEQPPVSINNEKLSVIVNERPLFDKPPLDKPPLYNDAEITSTFYHKPPLYNDAEITSTFYPHEPLFDLLNFCEDSPNYSNISTNNNNNNNNTTTANAITNLSPNNNNLIWGANNKKRKIDSFIADIQDTMASLYNAQQQVITANKKLKTLEGRIQNF